MCTKNKVLPCVKTCFQKMHEEWAQNKAECLMEQYMYMGNNICL